MDHSDLYDRVLEIHANSAECKAAVKQVGKRLERLEARFDAVEASQAETRLQVNAARRVGKWAIGVLLSLGGLSHCAPDVGRLLDLPDASSVAPSEGR